MIHSVDDDRSEIRRRIEEAGQRLRASGVVGALGILAPGVDPDEIETVAEPSARRLSLWVRQVQKQVMGAAPIDPSTSRGLAQTISVYVRALREMRHSEEDAGMIANLLVDLQFGKLSRRLPAPARDRLLAGLIHAVVELAPLC